MGVALPLNVMVMPGLPSLEQLATAGVRRISQGGSSFLAASGMLHVTTTAYLGGELHPPMHMVAGGVSVLPALIR